LTELILEKKTMSPCHGNTLQINKIQFYSVNLFFKNFTYNKRVCGVWNVASRLQICCHFIAYALYGGPLAAGGNSDDHKLT
jgi:hypothetical protein